MKKILALFLCFFAYYSCIAQTKEIEFQLYSLIATVTNANSTPPECSIRCGDFPTKPTSLDLPNSVIINDIEYTVTSIPDKAFQNGKNFIGGLYLPNNVKTIGKFAFQNCSGFTGSLIFPESTQSIGNKAFDGCSGITSLTLPNANYHNNSINGMENVKVVISLTDIDNLPGNIKNFITDIVGDGGTVIQPGDTPSDADTLLTMPIFRGGDPDAPNSWYNPKNWDPEGVPSKVRRVAIEGDLVISAGEIIEIDYITNAASSYYEAGTITIKDGGQLIHNDGLLNDVRIEKDIIGYGDVNNKGGWYLIAPPTSNIISNNYYNNLIEENGNYDLYFYNEADYHWHNFKDKESNKDFTRLFLGQGYLYANQNNTTITSIGRPNTNSTQFILSASSEENISNKGYNLVGFNLIGNPFTHDIHKGIAISNDLLKEGYYTLSTNGTWVSNPDSKPIEACSGILVETKDRSADGQPLFINKIYSQNTRRNSQEMLSIKVSNNTYEDVAYIHFDNDSDKGLRKIAHINKEAQMIYIPIEGVDYAIAKIDEYTNEIPISFKASRMGSYTISIDATKCNYDNVYLIDNESGNKIDILNNKYTFIASSTQKTRDFTLLLGDSKESNFAFINKENIVIKNIKGQGTVLIYDAIGHLIIRNEAYLNCNIPTELLTNGIYVVRLIDDNGIKTQKIAVNK
ncbi:MAG: leucine-rich repeat protein [Bacteroidales bacterium]|nr:leucine-rich repeat protein [Bacteroidales bacterium]